MTATIAYAVTHRTEYDYESDVSDSYGQLHLLPRDFPGQRCRASELVIDPKPEGYRVRTDFFGNRVSSFAIHTTHRELRVTATSEVEVDDRGAGPAALWGGRPWEEIRDGLRRSPSDRLEASQFALDSPLVAAAPNFAGYAAESFTPRRPLLDAATDLIHRIHEDFAYEPGATSVTTPVEEVFERREGVCQDFAHLGIACMRSIGLPARYVSGYLETDPPPGRPKLQGADFSHAWLSLLLPGSGWLDLDPTNDQLAGNRYVVAAYGRDYSDVPPLSGVIYTEGGTQRLRVVVDVAALPA
jgi:transglutaminase-like putative cysteine protease